MPMDKTLEREFKKLSFSHQAVWLEDRGVYLGSRTYKKRVIHLQALEHIFIELWPDKDNHLTEKFKVISLADIEKHYPKLFGSVTFL